MILAEKIIKLRKQIGWSQEELAEKMAVSRQSVSKWESANSIPDLNKIIILSELFNVSTDFLLKDENEAFEPREESNEHDTVSVNLESAARYVENKLAASALTTKGVILCICSVIPLFFFMAMAETNRLGVTENIAGAIGILCILVIVAIAVSFFIKTNQYEDELDVIENERFELAYGVHSVYDDKLKRFRSTYNRRLSIGIFLFITSVLPMLFASFMNSGSELTLMMVVVMMLIIAIGIYIVIPVSAQYEAYNNLLRDSFNETAKSKRIKRAEKLGAFYWPLVTAIYLGWSLWTMNWGVTWIVWPVSAVLFGALFGLMELLEKEQE